MATAPKRGRGRPPGTGKHQRAAASATTDTAALWAAHERSKAVTTPAPVSDEQLIAIGKAAQAYRNRYDAAGRGNRMASWNAPTSGPNTALDGLQKIRDRSRDASRNDWAAESGVTKWATNLVGIGITPRFKRLKGKRKQEITDLWQDFVKQADADCVLDLYGLQTLVTRAWLEGGECFVRRRSRFDDEGFAVPMQLQVLEADMVPLLNSTTQQGMAEGNKIKQGIEFNKRGRRVAYWFYKEHPSDDQVGYVPGASDLVRIMASEVCHVFEPKRPGTLRGVSMVAPVLARLRNIGNYEDVTLTRQSIANLWVGFISRALPALGADANALTGGDTEVDDSGRALVGLSPGLIQELEDGQEMNFSNPPEAGTTYSDYMRTSHLGTAAGAGLPYEIFSGDIKDVSDRTLRVLINEFRRFAEQRQWQILIPQAAQRWVEWFVDAAVLAGKIGIEETDDARRVEHAPHGWAHIHPVQDPQGKALEVEAGFRSRGGVVGERGDDVEQVDAERSEDDKREQKLNIGLYSKSAQQAKPTAAPAKKRGDEDGIDDDEYNAPPNARAPGWRKHALPLAAE